MKEENFAPRFSWFCAISLDQSKVNRCNITALLRGDLKELREVLSVSRSSSTHFFQGIARDLEIHTIYEKRGMACLTS